MMARTVIYTIHWWYSAISNTRPV